MRKLYIFLLLLVVAPFINAQTVWNGPAITFSKPAGVSSATEAGQDHISNNVWLTRDVTEGLFNIAKEGSYSQRGSSPLGTEWAYGSLSNYSSLTYKSWEGWNGQKPPSMLNKDAVLHLIDDNIYIAIKFTSWGGNGSGSFTYERSTASTLPVTLKSFTATLNRNSTVLNWTTAAEVNNKYFSVEHSLDGAAFSVVGRVEGSGSSATDHAYSFTHTNVARGVHYYRLGQYDNDGAVKLSQIVSVTLAAHPALHISPNPATSFITINAGTTLTGASYTVSSALGQALKKGIVNNRQVEVQQLPPGLYWLLIQTKDDGLLKAQFFKK